jgi:hypothetical protein
MCGIAAEARKKEEGRRTLQGRGTFETDLMQDGRRESTASSK